MENPIGQECPQCHQGTLKEKSGVSKKNNKPYNFVGCNNYPECKYIYKPENGQPKEDNTLNAVKIVNENVVSLHTKVDKIIDHLKI